MKKSIRFQKIIDLVKTIFARPLFRIIARTHSLGLILTLLCFNFLIFSSCKEEKKDHKTHKDWWICVETCGKEDAECVDKCTDDYNETHFVPGRKTVGSLNFKQKKGGKGKTWNLPESFIFCRPGTTPSPFLMPIYDEEGLFIIDYKTVWFCIDYDLEPIR